MKMYSSVGENIGELKRVVLDPQTSQVSHLVIEKGVLIKENKVVPVDLVQDEAKDRVSLKVTAEELEDFPHFSQTHFVLSQEWNERQDLEAYHYATSYHWWSSAGGLGYTAPRLQHKRLGNIPDDAVALKEGARVITPNGENVGFLNSVITDSENHEITHVVVSGGGFSPEKKLVPIFWVEKIADNEIDLLIREKYFNNLPEYKTE